MIGEVRDYIKGIISSVCPDLNENPSAFYDSDIGQTILDRTYQIEINNIISTNRSDHREDSMSVLVSIFGYGYRQETQNYDELLDKALCIRDELTAIRNFTGVSLITDAAPQSVIATQLPDNEGAFKIDIAISFTQAYSREE